MVIKGTLQGGMMGIGGEHSGFVLEGVALEVDLGDVEEAGDLAGQAVRLQGYFGTKTYVERGTITVFHVVAAKLATDTAAFPPAPAKAVQPGSLRTREQMRADALKLLEYDEEFRAEVRQLLEARAKAAER